MYVGTAVSYVGIKCSKVLLCEVSVCMFHVYRMSSSSAKFIMLLMYTL